MTSATEHRALRGWIICMLLSFLVLITVYVIVGVRSFDSPAPVPTITPSPSPTLLKSPHGCYPPECHMVGG